MAFGLRLYTYAVAEIVHIGLDVLGLIPVAGEVCDVTNGIIYQIQGDNSMAMLSYASAIPVLGWTATGLKYAHRIVATAGGTTALRWIEKANGKIMFGDRRQLRKVLGLNDANQAHHIIPWEFVEHDVVQAAAKAPGATLFHMNELLNGIPLLKSVHVEGMVHDVYNAQVEVQLELIKNSYGAGLTPAIARQEIDLLIGRIKTWIEQHPGVNLNNITL